MIGFLIRKTLYDLWDNMFKIVVLNLIFLALTAIPVFLPFLVSALASSEMFNIIVLVLGIVVCTIYLSAVAFSLKSISNSEPFNIKDVFSNLKEAWPAGVVMCIFLVLLAVTFTIILPFYLSFPSAVGLVLAAVIFWIAFFAVLSFQFYFTVYVRLGKNIGKSVKKCMLISLDNTGFSVFMFLHNFFVMVISLITAFLFPGPVGILLYLDEALRLRLLKYDWLEANPGTNRKKIPWDELLIDEREKTGVRSFRNFIFPWKD